MLEISSECSDQLVSMIEMLFVFDNLNFLGERFSDTNI